MNRIRTTTSRRAPWLSTRALALVPLAAVAVVGISVVEASAQSGAPAVSGLSVRSKDTDRAVVSWTTPTSTCTLTGFRLSLSPDGKTVDLPASATSAELSDIDFVQQRTVEVKAKCGASTGPAATTDFYVIPTPTSPPALLASPPSDAAAAAAVNATKNISVGKWVGFDEVSARSVQWRLCTSSDLATCTNTLSSVSLAEDATKTGYTPIAADLGKVLAATVTVTYPGGPSSSTVVVGPILPAGTDLAAFAAQGTPTTNPGDPGGPLASTGSSASDLALKGFGLIVAGVALLVSINRRARLADELVDNYRASARLGATPENTAMHLWNDRRPPPGDPPPGAQTHRPRRGEARPKCAHRSVAAVSTALPRTHQVFPQVCSPWSSLLQQRSSTEVATRMNVSAHRPDLETMRGDQLAFGPDRFGGDVRRRNLADAGCASRRVGRPAGHCTSGEPTLTGPLAGSVIHSDSGRAGSSGRGYFGSLSAPVSSTRASS